MKEWKEFELKRFDPITRGDAPYDGKPFLACIWGNEDAGSWVGQAIYARHYDARNRPPGKYEFFYVTQNPEDEGWGIGIEERPFPITHWMPLPPAPK